MALNNVRRAGLLTLALLNSTTLASACTPSPASGTPIEITDGIVCSQEGQKLFGVVKADATNASIFFYDTPDNITGASGDAAVALAAATPGSTVHLPFSALNEVTLHFNGLSFPLAAPFGNTQINVTLNDPNGTDDTVRIYDDGTSTTVEVHTDNTAILDGTRDTGTTDVPHWVRYVSVNGSGRITSRTAGLTTSYSGGFESENVVSCIGGFSRA